MHYRHHFKKHLFGIFSFILLMTSWTGLSAALVTSEADSGPGSLRALVNAGETTITFAPGIKTIRLESEIRVPGHLHLEAMPDQRVTLDGQSKTRILNLSTPGNDPRPYWPIFRADNIDFINGSSSGGGAIISLASDLILNSCRFINNRGYSPGSQYSGNGGAIFYMAGTPPNQPLHEMQINDCFFKGNKAGDSGGAILAYAPATSIQINRTTFFENTANYQGTVIFADQSAGIQIRACTFSNNGGIGPDPTRRNALILASFDGAVTRVDNCTFIDNYGRHLAQADDPGVPEHGEFLFKNCVFGPQAVSEYFSGEVRLEGGNYFSESNVGTISQMTPQDHIGTDPQIIPYLISGPGIASALTLPMQSPARHGGVGPVNYTDQFGAAYNNPPNSGALSSNYTGIVVTTTQDNASGNPDIPGSFRYAVNNTPAGGHVFLNSLPPNSTVNLVRQVEIDHPLTISGPGWDKVAIDGNHACRLLKVTADAKISGIQFKRGYDPSGGGGGIQHTGGTLNFDDCRFSYNFSGYSFYSAGAVYSAGAAGPASFRDCLFDYNSSQNGGGAHSVNGSLDFENCSFWRNYGYQGGAVRTTGAAGSASFRNCSFGENGNSPVPGSSYYGHSGGSALLISGTLSLHHCTVVGNKSNASGVIGAVHLNGTAGTVNVLNSVIALNNLEGGSAEDLTGNTTTLSGSLIGTDPLLENASLDFGNGTETFRLTMASPAHGLGSLADILPEDQLGNPRVGLPCEANPDAGAFEWTGCTEYCFYPPANHMDYIDSVVFDGKEIITGDNGGYLFVSNPILQLPNDRPFEVILTAGHLYGTWDQAWRIYLDLDQDGSFEDEVPVLDTYGDENEKSPDVYYTTLDLSNLNLPNTPVTMQIITDDWRVLQDPNLGPAGECGHSIFSETELYVVQFVSGSSAKTPSQAVVSVKPDPVTKLRPGMGKTGPASLIVYPNPARGVMNIFLENALSPLKSVQLFDLHGKLIIQKSGGEGAEMQLQLPALASGMYMLRGTDGIHSYTCRVSILE